LCLLESEHNVFRSCAGPLNAIRGVCPTRVRVIQVDNSGIKDVSEGSTNESVHWDVVCGSRVSLYSSMSLSTLFSRCGREIIEVNIAQRNFATPRAVGLDFVNRKL